MSFITYIFTLGFDTECWQEWGVFFKLAVFGLLMTWTEFLAWEIGIYLAGILATPIQFIFDDNFISIVLFLRIQSEFYGMLILIPNSFPMPTIGLTPQSISLNLFR